MDQPGVANISRPKTGTRPKDYLAVLLRRRWIIALATLSVFASTVYYSLRIKDVYEAFSVLVIEESNADIRQVMNSGGRPLSFYQGILNSRTFQEMVCDSIGTKPFVDAFPRFTPADINDYIQSSISLKTTSYTSFLRLNVRASTAKLAYNIASVATIIFRRRCTEVETEESRRAVTDLESQLKLIREQLETAEAEYRSFIDQSGNLLEGNNQELTTLQETYATNTAQLGIKEADLAAEKKQLESLEARVTPTSQARSPEYVKLRERLKELEKEKLKMESLGIVLSGLSTIDREISAIEAQLVTFKERESSSTLDPRLLQQWQGLRKSVLNKESDLDLYKRRLGMYRKAIANYKKKNPDILSESLELLRLKRSKETLENIYSILLEKAEEVRLRNAYSGAGIKIVDVPRLPDKPIPKNEKRYYILGLILGLALGLALALLIEFNDTTLKSNEDIERYLSLAVLGTIPHIVSNKKDELSVRRRSSKTKGGTSVTQYPRNLFNFAGDDSLITESYRSLRTNLSFTSPDKPLKAILLTSAGPGEGKSLTVSNLALAYAQMGKKTLVVDADLRRPMLHHLFQLKREPGFSELFMDEPDFDRIIRPTGKENLSIVTAGMFTPNPAELLASQKMAQLIEYFTTRFEMVFFDTPPIVAVTDATLLGKRLDGVLLVIKSHHTDRDVVSRGLNNLQTVGVHVLGAVLNDIDLSHRYSSYGYYKYYYHYYKSKTD